MKTTGTKLWYLIMGITLLSVFCSENVIVTPQPEPDLTDLSIEQITASTTFLEIVPGDSLKPVRITIIIGGGVGQNLTYTFESEIGIFKILNDGEALYMPPDEPGTYIITCSVKNNLKTVTESISIVTFSSERNSKIVYITSELGPYATDPRNIYVINPDGSGKLRLTDTNLSNSYPTWSPDGSKIAFISGDVHLYKFGLFIMDSNGENSFQVAESSDDKKPSWSPDGAQIAFSYKDEIYVVNIDGSNLTKITENMLAKFPMWFSDGSKIAFLRYDLRPYQIYFIDPDGSNMEPQLPFFDVRLIQTSLSLNGKSILFAFDPDGSDHTNQIGMAHFGDVEYTQYATGNIWNFSPDWSPTENRIVYNLGLDIAIMNIDGSGNTIITQGFHPDWSPIIKE